jgi:hypothetical protein
MPDEGGPVSKFEALLERVPIFDGGSRRRLTAGTVIILTVLLVFENFRVQLTTAATKDVSLTLLLAVGTLLIYAAGVLVELIGGVFLARAVSNAAWSYVLAAEKIRTWRPLPKFFGWIGIVVLWATARAIGYFAIGLFGASRWRIRLSGLSADAQAILDDQPIAVREFVQQSLGNNADFGRKALVDQLGSVERFRLEF